MKLLTELFIALAVIGLVAFGLVCAIAGMANP